MDPVAPCAPAPSRRVTPQIEVAAPGYALVGKFFTEPTSGQRMEYCEATKLHVRLSTSPLCSFMGRAKFTGNGIERIAVDPLLLQFGVMVPLQTEAGWMIAAGALALPLICQVSALAPSLFNEDIELVLTLEPGVGYEVDPPAHARMTAVELTLDIDHVARSDAGPAPHPLSAHDKVQKGAEVIADCLAAPAPRTRLTLHRARPYDFPHRLELDVSEQQERQHVVLCNDEQHRDGGVAGHTLRVDNAQIPLFGGLSCYVSGILQTGEDPVCVNARVENGDFGDYVNIFVDPLIAPRWGKAWLYPECTPALIDASVKDGDDRQDALCAADIVIDTGGLAPGTAASVTVHRCQGDGHAIDVPGLDDLAVNALGQVVTAGGRRPVFHSAGRRGSWMPWNAPFFFFKVHFPALGISRSTPADPVTQAGQCLKVKYLHAFVIDPGAANIEPERCRTEIFNYIDGTRLGDEAEAASARALADHRFLRPNLAAMPNSFSDWLDVVKNTYSYFHFSHGGYVGEQGTQSFFGAFWFGPNFFPFFSVNAHSQSAKLARRDLPRHLMFLGSCLSGLDPRLAKALIAGRQHCYVIAFENTVQRTPVQDMAGRFFYEWLVVCGGDPEQIPRCYTIASANHAALMPRLFSRDSFPK